MFYGMTSPFGPYHLDPSEVIVRADYFLIIWYYFASSTGHQQTLSPNSDRSLPKWGQGSQQDDCHVNAATFRANKHQHKQIY